MSLFDRAGWALDRDVAEFGRTLGEELLEPTKIYSLDCLALTRTTEVHAFCHITGGGLANNLARVIPDGLHATVDRSTWTPGRGLRPGRQGRRGRAAGAGEDAEHGRRHDRDRPRRSRWTSALTTLADRGVDAWVAGEITERGDAHDGCRAHR